MRRTCQAWVGDAAVEPKLCGEPAVDFVMIKGKSADENQKVWLCAAHWDEWAQYRRERNEEPDVSAE